MTYRNRGSIVQIGVEEIPGRKKKALVIKNGRAARVVGYFSNEDSAAAFQKALESFVRGAVIDDRDRRKHEEG